VTPFREAVLLPVLFLTVALLSIVDPGAARISAPSPLSLVLAALLLAALIRGSALAPEALVRSTRAALANLNGVVVLMTLFGASAALLTRLTPRTGLPALVVDVFLIVMLVNTLVVLPDRVRLLRSLAVILGATFVLQFVLLASLADPSASRTSRVLMALFDIATLGTVSQEPFHPASPYMAFAAIVIFLVGLATLPHERGGAVTAIAPRSGELLPDRH
jgi:hypothetical protein